MMVIDNKFNLSQIVYLTTDPDQLARVVTAIRVEGSGLVYQTTCATFVSEHYDFEISAEKVYQYT
jgi:hypothetical protein